MLARLKTIAGYGKGNVLSLDGYDEITVGRVHDSTIQVKERDISRAHCRIERFGTVWRVRDLKSHNGTFVNDENIDVEILKQDDKIKVGNTIFQIELLPGSATAEDAASDSPVEDTVDASSVDPFNASDATPAGQPAPQTDEVSRASWFNPIVLFAASFILTVGIGFAIVTMARAEPDGARKGDSQTLEGDEDEDETSAGEDLMKL